MADTSSTHSIQPDGNLYPYKPNEILPIIAAIFIGLSLAFHIFQNIYYRFWRVTFFLFYAGLVFLTGWILRAISSRVPSQLGLYIAQLILIYAGPPIYAAAEYNILGRLMFYLPMHAPLNPNMVKYFFIYLGALVEAFSGAGAGKLATSLPGTDVYISGGTLIAVAIVLQGVVECVFMGMVALMHYRCAKAGMLTRNVKMVCWTLYGTSTLVLLRCAFRAAESFTTYTHSCAGVYCGSVATHEWYLYVFEAAPMVVYTIWLNVFHPAKFLPANSKRYLDLDGKTERIGAGWIDGRPSWAIFLDPFNLKKDARSCGEHAEFWLRGEDWPVCTDGSFAQGSASNRGRREKTSESDLRLL